MQLSHIERRYFELSLAELDEKVIEFAMCKNGLLAKFLLEDVVHILNANYVYDVNPFCHDEPAWFFNSSKDRCIAMQHDKFVTVNPQFLKHFSLVVTYI